MCRDIPVIFGGNTVGEVSLEKRGLYYYVSCICKLSGDVMCRLNAQCGEKTADLGLLIPMDGGFGLKTRFPISRIGEGDICFRLTPKHDSMEGRKFVPLCPDEPFAYLSKLSGAFLEIRDGIKGISIRTEENSDDSQYL